MNICMMTYGYPGSVDEPLVSGEVKNPFYLARALGRRGHQVTVFNFGANRRGLREDGDLSFGVIQVFDMADGLLKGAIRNGTRILGCIPDVMKLQKRYGFDVFQVHLPCLALALTIVRSLRGLRIPIIVKAHGTAFPESCANTRGGFLREIMPRVNAACQLRLDRIAIGKSLHTIASSRYQVEEMIQIYRVARDSISVIYNGIDPSVYSENAELREGSRKRLGLDNNRVVLFVGRLVYKKGLQCLASAAREIVKQVPSTRFVIIGGTSRHAKHSEELKQAVESSGVGDKFSWFYEVPEKEMAAFYNAADICVVPSLSYESVPSVVFEAMACCTPVLATDRWGIPEVLGHKLALIPENDPYELAQRTVLILRDPDLSRDVAVKNSVGLEKFHWDRISQDYEALYKEIVL